MSARNRHIVNVVATAVLATILLCVGLFWARWELRRVQAECLPPSAREVTIYPSRQVTAGEGQDPNLLAPPKVTAKMAPGNPLLSGLGALHYLETRVPGMPAGPSMRGRSYLHLWQSDLNADRVYFDSGLGLMVRTFANSTPVGNGIRLQGGPTLYAGPNSIYIQPHVNLGRFTSPIMDAFVIEPQVVYDRGLRRFLAIRWTGKNGGINKGPELPNNDKYQPVQIGMLEKNLVGIDVPGSDAPRRRWQSPERAPWTVQYLNRTLVLDASGRIDWLDPNTLEIGGTAGHLPMPAALYGSRRSVARPEEVAAYLVAPFHRADSGSWGTAVATLSRDGLALRLAYFDASGMLIADGGTRATRYREAGGGGPVAEWIPSEKEAYRPGGFAAAKFLLESLHPPVFVLASYFAGPRLEATAGYRSVFFLPDSFVAMIARGDSGMAAWERFLLAMVCMLPGLLFVGLLAVKVERDGVRMGTSENARKIWIAATVILGLPAYITYRLTRPRIALVTCQNCGLGRRPDLDKCHRCGSVWAVPELIPPAWRVLGEPEQADEVSPSQAEGMGSPANEA